MYVLVKVQGVAEAVVPGWLVLGAYVVFGVSMLIVMMMVLARGLLWVFFWGYPLVVLQIGSGSWV
jgi:hypothetical protein